MRHDVSENFTYLRAGPLWDHPFLSSDLLRRPPSEADLYALPFISAALEAACLSEEGRLIISDEWEIVAGAFEVILLQTWHTMTPMTENSAFNLSFFSLNRH